MTTIRKLTPANLVRTFTDEPSMEDVRQKYNWSTQTLSDITQPDGIKLIAVASQGTATALDDTAPWTPTGQKVTPDQQDHD